MPPPLPVLFSLHLTFLLPFSFFSFIFFSFFFSFLLFSPASSGFQGRCCSVCNIASFFFFLRLDKVLAHHNRLILAEDSVLNHELNPDLNPAQNPGVGAMVAGFMCVCVCVCVYTYISAVSKELVPSRRGLVDASIQNHIDMQRKTNSKLEMIKKKVPVCVCVCVCVLLSLTVDWVLENCLSGRSISHTPYHYYTISTLFLLLPIYKWTGCQRTYCPGAGYSMT